MKSQLPLHITEIHLFQVFVPGLLVHIPAGHIADLLLEISLPRHGCLLAAAKGYGVVCAFMDIDLSYDIVIQLRNLIEELFLKFFLSDIKGVEKCNDIPCFRIQAYPEAGIAPKGPAIPASAQEIKMIICPYLASTAEADRFSMVCS